MQAFDPPVFGEQFALEEEERGEGVVRWRGSPSLTGDTECSMFREIYIRSRLMTSGLWIGWKTFVKRAHKVKTKVFRNKEYLFGKTCAGWGQ